MNEYDQELDQTIMGMVEDFFLIRKEIRDLKDEREGIKDTLRTFAECTGQRVFRDPEGRALIVEHPKESLCVDVDMVRLKMLLESKSIPLKVYKPLKQGIIHKETWDKVLKRYPFLKGLVRVTKTITVKPRVFIRNG